MVLPTLDSYITLKKLQADKKDTSENINHVSRPNSQDKYLSSTLNEETVRDDEFDFNLTDKLILDDLHFNDQQDQEKQTQREIRIVQLKIILQQQMDQMKKIEQQLDLFQQQQQSLLEQQNQFDQYQQQIKQLDRSYFQQDSNRQLLRQHKGKLHKRAKQIQEQLEFHLKHLEILVKQDQQEDLLKLIKQFQDELYQEKQIEEQYELMYQDELAKQWPLQEQLWNQQSLSRDKLIEAFLDKRQEDIEQKLILLKQQIKDLYLEQQTLLQEMEQARKYQLIQKQNFIKQYTYQENSP